MKGQRALPHWRGVVFCEIVSHSGPPPYGWGSGDWVLEHGQFKFYGDPEVIARIAAVLRERA